MTTELSLDGYAPAAGDRVRTAAVALTGVTAVALTARGVTALTVNTPSGPSRAPVTGLTTVATALAALALVAAGASDEDPVVGLGLLFGGVFGSLSVVSASAAVPAAVAVVAGTTLFLGADRAALDTPTLFAAGLLVVALGVGLASGVGGAPSIRGPASQLALLGIGASPVFAAANAGDLLGGVGALAAVVAVGLSVPFVTGAVTLVALGAVGASLPLVAVAVAGAVTTASAAVRERRWLLLAGVVLLTVAGVPSTLDRAIPFALGLATLVEVNR